MKNMSSSVGTIIPNIWKKTSSCSKPSARLHILGRLYRHDMIIMLAKNQAAFPFPKARNITSEAFFPSLGTKHGFGCIDLVQIDISDVSIHIKYPLVN